jgi:hypothetical protein
MEMRAGSTMGIRASSALQITAAAEASLLGSMVALGCSSGKAVARMGDQVNTTVSPAVIVQGSPTVRVC